MRFCEGNSNCWMRATTNLWKVSREYKTIACASSRLMFFFELSSPSWKKASKQERKAIRIESRTKSFPKRFSELRKKENERALDGAKGERGCLLVREACAR